MIRIQDWTLDEFRTLLAGGGTSPVQLALRLPGRALAAVGEVQQALHAFHLGRDYSILSRLMVSYLEELRGYLACPVCGRVF
jgi:hypothetical protein